MYTETTAAVREGFHLGNGLFESPGVADSRSSRANRLDRVGRSDRYIHQASDASEAVPRCGNRRRHPKRYSFRCPDTEHRFS